MIADPELVAGCKNGSCPKIFLSGTKAAVQGTAETWSTRQVTAGAGKAVVEIPVSVFVEALTELGMRGASHTDRGGAADPEAGPLVWRIGDVVIVCGDRDTELTKRVEPGVGELVVEVPLGVLLSYDDLAVV